MTKEITNSYTIKTNDEIGEVIVLDEVIAVIAGLAAMEVEGVESMVGNATRELISKLGVKSLSKGVRAIISNKTVAISLAINLKYGYNIGDVSKKIQEKVKASVENMTGITVSEVNIRIAGVEMK